MLNQLKEEYIYARFLCYDGSEKIKDLHYADKEVKLSLSDYDYVNYSIRLEQLKSAFRLLFSIFDKVAFFVLAKNSIVSFLSILAFLKRAQS
jgi:hypothetical protein